MAESSPSVVRTAPATDPRTASRDGEVEHHPIVVVGGGLGAVAAVLAIARAGGRVTLLADADTLGGQMTRQGVSPLDEHALIESDGAAAGYRELRERIRAHYRRLAPDGASEEVWHNPGDGWVSRLCFEPSVGARVLTAMLAEYSERVVVATDVEVVTVRRVGTRITALELSDPECTRWVGVDVVVDATEDGSLLPLADAPWTIGAESRTDTGEALAPAAADPRRVQSLTVVAALRRDAAPGPIVPRPPGYDAWRTSQPFRLDEPDAQGRARHFPMFTPEPDAPLTFWGYRRIRADRLGGPELAVINWPGNDYRDRPSLGDDHDAVVADARRLTTAFVHWLQTEAPRDDGGLGHPELQPAPEVFGTRDGLAPDPYLREARRLRARRRILAEDILADERRGARARTYPDTAGVGWYPMDVHAAVGAPSSRNDPTSPFQVPLSALVADRPVNLVVGGTAIGTTHLTNGAYRVHPVEWAIGEAAGTLALEAVEVDGAPATLVERPAARIRIQRRLLAAGTPIAWTVGVDPAAPCFVGLQLLASQGALAAPGLRDEVEVDLHQPLHDADLHVVRDAATRLAAALRAPTSSISSARTLEAFSDAASALVDDHLGPAAHGAGHATTPTR